MWEDLGRGGMITERDHDLKGLCLVSDDDDCLIYI
jgi:hypothetical protein